MRLLGMGKGRFHSLRHSAKEGHEFCPFDQRYIPKGPQLPSEKKTKVHEYLMQLYLEAAEPIPDGLNSNKRPRQGKHKLDPKNMNRSLIKHLPHGSIHDYYVQCCSINPMLNISKRLFNSVACMLGIGC